MKNIEKIWGKKYPIVFRSWNENWEELTHYFQYDEYIRKIIYTTNAVEGFHRQVRKVTKTKGAFSSDMALLKLIYLASQNIAKKWTQPVQNWGGDHSTIMYKIWRSLKNKSIKATNPKKQK